jgi:hypothetical protein
MRFILSYEVHPSNNQRSVGLDILGRPSMSTLQEGSLQALLSDNDPGTHVDWSATFSALGRNTGLKTLSVDVYNSMDDSLCTAMQNGLTRNETLETLELNLVPLYCAMITPICGARRFPFSAPTRLSIPSFSD